MTPRKTDEKTPETTADEKTIPMDPANALAAVENLALSLGDTVPPRALAVWLRPILAHLAPKAVGLPIGEKTAALAELCNVPFRS